MGHGVDRRGGRWNCGLVVTVIDMGLGCGFVIWNCDQHGFGLWVCDLVMILVVGGLGCGWW